jgi:hypothetical protein
MYVKDEAAMVTLSYHKPKADGTPWIRAQGLSKMRGEKENTSIVVLITSNLNPKRGYGMLIVGGILTLLRGERYLRRSI